MRGAVRTWWRHPTTSISAQVLTGWMAATPQRRGSIGPLRSPTAHKVGSLEGAALGGLLSVRLRIEPSDSGRSPRGGLLRRGMGMFSCKVRKVCHDCASPMPVFTAGQTPEYDVYVRQGTRRRSRITARLLERSARACRAPAPAIGAGTNPSPHLQTMRGAPRKMHGEPMKPYFFVGASR
jgi:hypothetical protein